MLALLVLCWHAAPARGGFVITNLVTFNGCREICLTPGLDGFLYGTTDGGGDFGAGTLFRMSTSGTLTTLASFSNTNGTVPWVTLVRATDDNLYGIGLPFLSQANCLGTIFRAETNGTVRTLATFYGTNGSSPSSLLESADGAFYGATSYGGSYTNNNIGVYGDGSTNVGYGTLFRVTTNGTLTTLYSFDGTNGAGPGGQWVRGEDGAFMGVTSCGGTYNVGTIWKLGTNGLFNVLATFDGTNGAHPTGLMLGKDGNFYGTTLQGGSNLANFGSLFRVSKQGILTPMAAFTGSNGRRPTDVPVLGPDGNLYGTTYFGGDTSLSPYWGWGVMFQLTPGGLLSAPATFEPPATLWTWGVLPRGKLVAGPNGSFYGVSGTSTGQPTFIFQITPNAGENLTDPARATADDDGDGISNLLEYGLGSDLQNPADSQAHLRLFYTAEQDGNHLNIQFRRRVDWSVLQMQYTPEVSTDGQLWFSDSTHLAETAVQPGYDGFELITVTDMTPVSANGCRFLRLRIGWSSPAIASRQGVGSQLQRFPAKTGPGKTLLKIGVKTR